MAHQSMVELWCVAGMRKSTTSIRANGCEGGEEKLEGTLPVQVYASIEWLSIPWASLQLSAHTPIECCLRLDTG